MSVRARWLSAGLALALAGCGSYAEDVAALCDAPNKAALPPGSDQAEQARLIVMTALQALHTSRGKQLLAAMATMSRTEKVAALRKAAAEQGVTKCAWADWYEAKARPVAPTVTATTATATAAAGAASPSATPAP